MVLLFVSSTTAVAQKGITYEVGDYFKITYPDNFEVRNESLSPYIFGSRLEERYSIFSTVDFFAIPIAAYPIERQGINENFTFTQNVFLNVLTTMNKRSISGDIAHLVHRVFLKKNVRTTYQME